MLMLHAPLVTLGEALAIVVALMTTYGRMPIHLGALGIHRMVAAHVVASGFDAVLIAAPAGVMELGRGCIPRAALRGILIFVIALLLLGIILCLAVLLRMETDSRKCGQGKC